MKPFRILIPCLVVSGLLLSGCQNPKQTGGAILGTVAGGVLGSNVGKGKGRLAATAVGAVAGAIVGSEIGKSLDNIDRMAMRRTTQTALEKSKSGQVSTWSNPDSGNSGTITARPAYKNQAGRYCREYQQTVTIGGQTESAYGTACRQPDGTWKIVG